MKLGKKITVSLLVLFMLIQVSVATLAIEPISFDLEDEELNEEAELALFLESFGMNEIPSKFKVDFTGLGFAELMEAMSEELLEVLYGLGITFHTETDLDQLLDLEEEIWAYMWEQPAGIFWEFYQLVLAFTPDEYEDDPDEALEMDESDSKVGLDESDDVEELGSDVVDISTPESVEEPEEGVELAPLAEVEIAPTNVNTALTTTAMSRTGVTVENNVTFRRGPSHEDGTIRQIPVNTNVRITGRRGHWYRIVHHGTTGWVERPRVQQTRQTAIVRGNRIPVRHSNASNARILTRAARGTRVIITERTANWARVTVNRRTGWIRTNQLTITNGRRPGRTRGQANLHARPHASSAIRRSLPRHQAFMILQRTTGGWTQVVIRHSGGTQTGWIRTNQVQTRNQVRQTRGRGNVPVRTGPGTNFRVGRRIPRQTRVTVLAESGSWSHVRFNHNGSRRHGWIQNSRLTQINRLPQPHVGSRGAGARNPTWGVTYGRAQLRNGTGASHRILRTIADNRLVNISRRSGAWLRVTYRGQTGWLHENSVRIGTTNTATPTRNGRLNTRTELRRGAGNNHGVIRTLNSGTSVTILRQSGNWLRVRAGNDTGWVREELVNSTTPGVLSLTAPLRSGPGNNHSQIRTVRSGITVTILRQQGQWSQVRVEGQTGWMRSLYINIRHLSGLPNVRNTISSAVRTVNVTGETGLRFVVPQRRTLGAGNGFDFLEGVRVEHVNANGGVTRIPITWHQASWSWRFTHNGRTFTVNIEGILDNLTPGTYERQFMVRRGNTVVARADQTIVVR